MTSSGLTHGGARPILSVMRLLERLGRSIVVLGVFAVASYFALRFGTGGLWRGLEAAQAVTAAQRDRRAPYDLTQLVAVNQTLYKIRDKYVDPTRIKPRQMFLSALNHIQREVAQVIVLYPKKPTTVTVRVDTEEKKFRVDNIQAPWDVAARLREVFAFLQTNLHNTGVDLRDVEYAACNGMLTTLDPHSAFLSPDAYREMNMATVGHFGGLGIVISMRDQMLTIMRPMPDTPAGRAELKRLDRIMKIDNESTLNMPLDEAVKRLRGRPGSKVTVWIHRDGKEGWNGARPFELVREEIRIKSVESRALGRGVGYVRISQFSSTTAGELEAALKTLRKTQLKGLVLDLRNNPGGLLDQAAKVADTFLPEGVIVATVGASEAREEKRASRAGTERAYPMVVLVSESSASASEIVAGALKSHGRAVLVGQRTFGKGTVQLVFSDITPDQAALKLTIAQYLTPGDVSIQGVGVAPDIELDPMTADTLEMDLFRSEEPLRERDLSKSLDGTAKRNTEQPFFTLRYNLPNAERTLLRELGDSADDEFRLDYPIRFAQDLVAGLPIATRANQLEAARAFLDREQQKELQGVTADLSSLGVDWSAPHADLDAGPRAGDYEVRVTTDRPNDTVTAGERMSLRVSVKNKSDKPIYQLRAVTKSDSAYFDARELAFGKIPPGETKTATTPFGWCDIDGHKAGSTKPLPPDARRVCKLPMSAETRQDIVLVRFHAVGGEAPPDAEVRPTLQSLPQPIFAYSYQVADNRPGNGDGQLSDGEGATLYLTVKNVGKGRSYETQANLRNLTGDALALYAGRFDLSEMQPGDVRHVAFTFDVVEQLTERTPHIELSVVDRDLRVASQEKVTLPVAQTSVALAKAEGASEVHATASVRVEPADNASIIGELKRGSVVERMATFGDFTKVRLGADRFGFVETKALTAATGRSARYDFEPHLERSPPLLEVQPVSLSTRDAKIHIEGLATDADRVLDTFIFVGARKVFYRSNRRGSDPKHMPFKVDADLDPGINVITVVSRESEDTASRQTLIVRRDGPNGELLPTPKRDLVQAAWEPAAE